VSGSSWWCRRSLIAATGNRRHPRVFGEVSIVLVDDGSPQQLATLLPQRILDRIEVLRIDTRRGQGAALNAAIRKHPAAAYAFTDSDCVVAPDWIRTIDALASTKDDGAAGPPWRHQEARGRKARWLTEQETRLVRHCTTLALERGTTRLDCRNVWLSADVAAKNAFPEDAGAALSGVTSRLLDAAGVRLGFAPQLAVRHEPITSVRAQALTYFRRGATSDLATHYAAGHRSLSHAFTRTYARRHLVAPIRAGVSPGYVLLTHGAYWCGLIWRGRSRWWRRSRRSRVRMWTSGTGGWASTGRRGRRSG
jgi:hypothetical protein